MALDCWVKPPLLVGVRHRIVINDGVVKTSISFVAELFQVLDILHVCLRT